MDSNALEVGQDACDTHTDMSPFVMDVVVGQFLGAGHVQPRKRPSTRKPLSEMDDRSSEELLANLFQACLRVAGKLAGGGENGRLRGRMTVERSQQLSDARQGDELLTVQVAGERFQTGTILRRLRHVGGKFSLHAHTTAHCFTST